MPYLTEETLLREWRRLNALVPPPTVFGKHHTTMPSPEREARDAEICRLRLAGLQYQEIASKMGLTIGMVSGTIKRRKLTKTHGVRPSREEILDRNTKICDLKDQGWTYEEIAEELSISTTTVGGVLKKKYIKSSVKAEN